MKNKIAKFEKVSLNQFIGDWISTYGDIMGDEAIRFIYDDISLPKRSTQKSAGYDFVAPFKIDLEPGMTITIPTGIRCAIEDGWVLQLYPRSGLGFKYGLRLENTVGIIDADYYQSSNEGHIFIKLTNGSKNKTVQIKAGTGMMQGIFVPFGITVDDEATGIRDGGFGSTDQ